MTTDEGGSEGARPEVPEAEGAELSLPDGLAGLRALYAEALRVGVVAASDPEVRRRWLVDARERAERALGRFFGPEAACRPVALASLDEALERGVQARRAYRDAERGLEVDEDAPLRFLGATVPPDPVWLAEEADDVVQGLAASAQLLGVTLPGLDLDDVAAGTARPFSTVVSGDAHRVRSGWLRDEREENLYQLIVVRRDEEVHQFRRYLGEDAYRPTAGTFTADEVRFLARAYAEIDRVLRLGADPEAAGAGEG